MRLVKMHGLGNDYVYADCMESRPENPAQLAVRISDRHFGVGSDGLILVGRSDKADFSMDIYNADGSRAEMCGNGIRCAGKFVYDYGYTQSDTISIETLGGIKILRLIIENNKCVGAVVDMGEPVFSPKKIPVIWNDDTMIDREVIVGGRPYRITAVNLGNPHAVTFVKDVDGLNIEAIGPLIENHSIFPARVNAEFAKVLDRKTVRMRVWERGSGETFACGTGATATAIAAILNGYCDREVIVKLNGGDLKITWDEKTNHVFMEGSATYVCEITGYDTESGPIC
ncbi:MAG: diaminopimelate epimerase [Clostridia bacterium]|nr:diaminopimelate epimerase [Clostridia bacterium]